MTPSPVAPEENYDNFLALYYRVDVEVLNNWADEKLFMRGSIGYVVQDLDFTGHFCPILTNFVGGPLGKKDFEI